MIFYLIGYPFCGKSTLGEKLSLKFGIKHIDFDKYLEDYVGKSIPEIWALDGDGEIFRKLERNALINLHHILNKNENVIISLGGGTPCHYDNMELLNKSGITIYLKTSFNILFKRIMDDPFSRPKFKKLINLSRSEAEKIIFDELKEREKYYLKANIVIDNDEGINFEWTEPEPTWVERT